MLLLLAVLTEIQRGIFPDTHGRARAEPWATHDGHRAPRPRRPVYSVCMCYSSRLSPLLAIADPDSQCTPFQGSHREIALPKPPTGGDPG